MPMASRASRNLQVEQAPIADPDPAPAAPPVSIVPAGHSSAPVASPALALQAAVAQAFVSDLTEAPEPAVRKWPGVARAATLLVGAAGAWAAVIGLIRLALG